MKLTVNGQIKEFTTAETLQTLVKQFCKAPDHVIAELNGSIVDRAKWPAAALKDGDKLELVTFVGGG